MSPVSKRMWNISLLIMYTIFCNLCIATLLELFHISISVITLPFSVLTAVVICRYIGEQEDNKGKTKTILCFLFVFATLTFIAGHIYSNDWDGNAYHKMAVGFLKNGWNPLYESSEAFSSRYFGNSDVPSMSMWVDHYGKGSWYFAASVYALTRNIECGKVYNLLAVVAFFGVFFNYLQERYSGRYISNIVVAFLATANPIIIAQSFEYYVDGFLGTMLFVLIIGLTLYIDDTVSNNKKKAWSVILPSMVILGNIKFTGLMYGGIFCVIFFLYNVIRNWKTVSFGKHIKSMFNFIIVAVITIIWVGGSTYIRNFMQHGNPLYPLAGVGKVDVVTSNSPMGFKNKPSVYKLFYSVFGKSENLGYIEERPLPELKIPFTTSAQEIKGCVSSGDVRIGGFGVFFSGLLLIALLILIIWLIRAFINRAAGEVHKYIIMYTGTIIVMLVAVSDSWWARYSPYMYMLLILALVIMVYYGEENIRWRILRGLFVLVLVVNNLIFLYRPYAYIKGSYVVEQQFKELENTTITVVNEYSFPGLLFDLEDRNIRFNLVYGDDQKADQTLYYGQLGYCKE